MDGARSVVTLGSRAAQPAVLRGIAEAFFPGGASWVSSDGQERRSSVRPGGHVDGGTPSLGSLLLTTLNGLDRLPRCVVLPLADSSAREAIAAADLIVLGPGSACTHLLPALLVRGVAEEIGRSRARVALVTSLMTEPGGRDGYVASDCVRAIRRHAPEVPIHDVILNDTPIRSDLVVSCARNGALPIGYDTEAIQSLGCRPLKGDLLWDGPVVRHDPRKIGLMILRLADEIATGARDRPRARASAAPACQGISPADSVVTG
jgi:hypothetical protein